MSNVFLSWNDPVCLTGFYKSEWTNRLHVYPSSSSFRLSSTLFFAVVFSSSVISLFLLLHYIQRSFYRPFPVLLSCCVFFFFFFFFKCCQRKLNWFLHHTLSTHWLPASRDAWIERARRLVPRTPKERAPASLSKDRTLWNSCCVCDCCQGRRQEGNGKRAGQWRVSVSKLIGDWLLWCGQVQQWGAY